MIIFFIFLIPIAIGYTAIKVIKITLLQYGIKDVYINKSGVGWVYYNNCEPSQPTEPDTIPYYIDDEIEAIYTQLDVYNRMIEHYINDLEYTTNVEQRLKVEKKIGDLKYKCSRLENKVNKLLEKWEG